jgi:hypothetical protein
VEWLRLITPADAPVFVIDETWIAPAVGETVVDGRSLPTLIDPRARELAPLVHSVYHPKRVRPSTPHRAMAVAYWIDMVGVERHEAAQYANLNDWQHPFDKRSKGIERLLIPGRQLLHELGAWPWSIAQHPPQDWRGTERFALALSHWHRTWWTTNYVKAQQAAAAVAGPPPGFLTPTLQTEAQARYFEAIEHWSHRARPAA